MKLIKALKLLLGDKKVKRINRKVEEFNCKMLTRSLKVATEEQGLTGLVKKLKLIVPDISEKETGFKIEGPFWSLKVYALYSFQVQLLLKAISFLDSKNNEDDEIVYADVGDSCGNHILFIKELLSGKRNLKTCSINIDPVAIEKLKSKGLEAVQIPVEKIESIGLKANIIATFQMLEHLHDPATFMYKISNQTQCDFMVLTVPYLTKSRVGMQYIRNQFMGNYLSQDVHIFELCPKDWMLLFKHSGWKPVYQETYYQYPKKHYLRMSKKLWEWFDYEGFWGVILERDSSWSKCYVDWKEISESS